MTPVDVILANPTGEFARMETGVVTQVSPLLVRVGAAQTGTPATAFNYTPTLGDKVGVLVQGVDRWVLGIPVS